ncbi:MAG: hemolysin family protein [Chloroflexota bacterium]
MESTLTMDLIGILAIIIFVLANAFFVAAEFALVSVRRTRVAELVARGQSGAEAVQHAIENPDRVIAATQLGITLASLALGWIGEPALSHLIKPLVDLFPNAAQSEVSHTISAAFAFTVITFMHVVIGELAPKSIALQNPERTALFVAGPTLLTERIFKPAIWALNGAGNILLRLVGIQPASGHGLAHSVEELKMLVDASTEGGVMEADESDMLHAVFDFGEMVVRQVMVPRTEITSLEADTPLEEIIRLATQSTYTKFPVYEKSLDQIIGIVHVRDLLISMQSLDCQGCTARSLLREPLFAPETLSVSGLLRLFRDNRQHIAIVLDEFGGTAGMVTLEDLMEEIVGEVNDPFDASAPGIQLQPDGSVLVDGLTLIEEVNEELELKLEEAYYDTIAGFVMGRLGRIPRLHDVVEAPGMRIRVEEMDRLRVARVRLTRVEPAPEPGQETPPTPSPKS